MSGQYIFKVIGIGRSGIGKTRFLSHFTTGYLDNSMAIGASFGLIDTVLDPQTLCKLQISNLTPRQRFLEMYPEYCRGVSGVLMFFDSHRNDALNEIRSWVHFIRLIKENPPIILIGMNHSESSAITNQQAHHFTIEYNIDAFFWVKTVEDPSNREIFIKLSHLMVERHQTYSNSNFVNNIIFRRTNYTNDSRQNLIRYFNYNAVQNLLPPPPPFHEPYIIPDYHTQPLHDIPPAPNYQHDRSNVSNTFCHAQYDYSLSNHLQIQRLRDEMIQELNRLKRILRDEEPNDSNNITVCALTSLREEMLNELERLRQIMRGNDDEEIEKALFSLTGAEKELYDNFVKFYYACPVCGDNNHRNYINSFYFSQKVERQNLRDYLLEYMDYCLNHKNSEEKQLKLGIPCCNCYKKYFNEDEAIRG